MTCSRVRESFSDHLDGLPVTGLRGFFMRLHLAICPTCRRFNVSLAATQDALHSLKDAPPPEPK